MVLSPSSEFFRFFLNPDGTAVAPAAPGPRPNAGNGAAPAGALPVAPQGAPSLPAAPTGVDAQNTTGANR
jgi:hypothetical protein